MDVTAGVGAALRRSTVADSGDLGRAGACFSGDLRVAAVRSADDGEHFTGSPDSKRADDLRT